MPPSTKKSRPIKNPKPPGPGEVVLGEVLTLAEAAAYLRVSQADVLGLITEQALPARKVGGEWRFLKGAIAAWLADGTGETGRNKGFWDLAAGAFVGDPHLAEILEEAMQRRGRDTSGAK